MNDSLTTISGACIALTVAILGLAYPMFVERVDGIVNKYGSPNISKKFKNEPSFICFNVFMIVCIIELFLVPFLIMVFNTQFCNILLISIQGLSVLALCMGIIMMYFLVMTYNDPHSFFNRIKINDTNEKKLINSLQILIEYGSRNDMYADIYKKAMDMLVERIFKFQKEYVDMGEKSQAKQVSNDSKPDGEQVAPEYPEYIFNTLVQLSISSTKPNNPVLNKNPKIVDVLYNLNDDFPITDQVYDFMWDWIKRMVEEKYDEWVRQYWLVANQTNYSKWGYYDAEEREGIDEFLKFHLMIGVLFLRWNRYDFIRYIFTFNSLRLPKYPLIPNSFDKIFNYCETFPWSDETYSKYNLFKNWEGSSTEKKIENLFLDYIALLVVRLYDNMYGGSRKLPPMGAAIEENEYKINRIETIIWHLEKISDDTINKVGLNPEWKQEAKKLLETFKGECEKENENLKTRRVVSEEKREYIRQNLIETSKKCNPFLPSSECGSKEDGDEISLADFEKTLPDEMILASHRLIQSPDLVESIIQGLHIKLRESYCGKLLQMGAIKTYLIAYRDSGEVLKRLELTSEYAILALAVSPNTMAGIREFNMDADKITYQGNGKKGLVNVYSIPSCTDSMVLIMRETDVPRFRYRDLEEDEYVSDGLSEIETEKHLYSNIDNITETELVLKVKQGYYVHIPKSLKYVCIRIQSGLESDTTDVSNVEPIKNLIQ